MPLSNLEDLKKTVLSAPIGLCVLDAETLVAELVNEKFLEVAGRSYETIAGKFYWDAFPEVRNPYEKALEEVVKTGKTYRAEEAELMLVRHGRKEPVIVSFIYEPLTAETGEVRKVAIWVLENTRQVSERRAITASEERLRALVTATSDVIYSLSADWEVMRELDGRGFLKSTHEPIRGWRNQNVYPADMEMINQAIAAAIKEKKIFQLEHRVWRADGTPGWTFSRAVPILDDQGEIVEWFGAATDITNRKQIEADLTAAREEADRQKRVYETITSGTPDLMYVWDLDYKFTYVNRALLDMWGRNWEESIGKGLRENGYEEWHAAMHEREMDQVRVTKKPVRGEVSFPHATLGRRIYDYILIPVFNEFGEVEAVAGTTRDVTERKQLEDALAKSAEEFSAINEELASANEEQAASNEELSATNNELALVNQQLEDARRRIEESDIALRLAIDAANFGTWFIHSVTREFITDARLKELFGYYPDEPLSIEQALAQITEDYRGFVADKLEKAIYHNGDYDVTYPVIGLHDNRLRWLRAIGNLKADASGAFSAFTGVVMDITEQHLAAQKLQQAEEGLRMALASGELAVWHLDEKLGTLNASPRFNELFGFKAGEIITYEMAITQIQPGYRQKVEDAVSASFHTGANFSVEYPINHTEDGKPRWVRSVGKYVRDEKNGNYITGVMADITEQKSDEIRKNDFIGMVSHELKTPLTSLTAIIQVAHSKLKSSEDAFLAGAMNKADIQVKKMAGMINGFLNISRLESGKILIEKQRIDLQGLIAEVISETTLTVYSHPVHFVQGPPIMVDADPEKISSVLTNLISNAVKYSPKGKAIEIGCHIIGNTARVSVKDEGLGIKPEDLDKIFDRYYRVETNQTKSISGFGIGLYLSSEIILRHDGKIWAESEPGQGSTFYFSLPAV